MTAPDAEPSPLASPEPWNLVADGYVVETMPHFEKYAAHALMLADLAPRSWVLDVACGPGTLSLLAARAGHRVSAIDFASGMVERLRDRAGREGLQVEAQVGDGQALPYPQASFEGAFSMFGLMFFPDRHAGLTEIARVLKPRGRCVISSWTPMDKVPLLASLIAAMQDALPNLPFGKNKAPLGEPDEMRDELAAAGFADVRVEQVAFAEQHADVRSLWRSFERGGAPCVLLQKKLGPDAWSAFSSDVISGLERDFGTGPVSLAWHANLGVGEKR
jgi:ubiquinone/menaquinone biosynthesis C-methylase UbiE